MGTLKIFEVDTEENVYYLLNKRGRRVPDAQWNTIPRLQSGVFIATKNKIFTVLGEEVKGLEADTIFSIMNFWVYYERGEQKYISRLEPLGLKFRLKVETPIDEVGFLSHDGCVVKIDGRFIIYNYEFGTLIEDTTKPDVSFGQDVTELLQLGFTVSYLRYLSNELGLGINLSNLTEYDTLCAWETANDDFTKIVMRLSEIMDSYTPSQLGQILGLRPYIISVITQYLEVNNFIAETNNE